nr:MAG TPA: hypothetical protein [Caudoviricetes sp.]
MLRFIAGNVFRHSVLDLHGDGAALGVGQKAHFFIGFILDAEGELAFIGSHDAKLLSVIMNS